MKTLAIALTLTAAATAAHADDYAQPWQLQSVSRGNTIHAESSAAVFNDEIGNVDIAMPTVVSARYQLTDEWAPMLRLGMVGNNAPGAALDGGSFANPLLGGTYTRARGNRRLGVFAATTLPIGTTGTMSTAKTNRESMTARPADEAMFEVDYATAIAGVDAAYVSHGITAQAEASFHEGVRVRGSETEATRTSATFGFHVGRFIGSHVSLGSDIYYQRWLGQPLMDSRVDSLTVAVGARLHVHAGNATLHPGLSIMRGVGGRGGIISSETTAVQLDLPLTF